MRRIYLPQQVKFRNSAGQFLVIGSAALVAGLIAIATTGPTGQAVGQDANETAASDAGAAQAKAAATKIEPTGPVEAVMTDFEFTEGPAWDGKGSLLFTDIPNNTIHRLSANDQLSTFTDQSNHANGLMFTSDGRLLACEMDGQVVAYDPGDGERTVLADQFNGKRFNAPNDLVIDKQGGIYFTDPLFRAPQPLPQTAQTVYYIATDGEVSRLTDNLPAPNGIGLSPDGSQLYVIPSQQAEMLVYDILAPGNLGKQRVLCRLKQPNGQTNTGGDGMAVDVEGNVYLTTHLGIQIFSPAGDALGLVEFPQQPANVTFGGSDRKTMYVTARTGLYRVPMPIAGLVPN